MYNFDLKIINDGNEFHMMSKENKTAVIKKFAVHEKDTGSSKVQVAILTEKINTLTTHFNTHKKDHHSRLGLLKMVGKRRRHLDYLKKTNFNEYQGLLSALSIRK